MKIARTLKNKSTDYFLFSISIYSCRYAEYLTQQTFLAIKVVSKLGDGWFVAA